jgi:alkanesulfonate monooxygenase SsuD/methylene tetrahydromethanopterin reductase-like flavin-dependent oxidoreductase (luciferase family)
MHQVGAKPASQLTLLEEVTAAVRALLRGETVDTEGRYVRLRGVALDHPPASVPPVSLGVRGPKSLRLSGRCADGTVIDASAGPDDVAAARAMIDEGRAAAGRTDPHRLTVFAVPGADPDAYAAAGTDCLVFMSPDGDVPLDLAALSLRSRT